jgi:hypothetical protein
MDTYIQVTLAITRRTLVERASMHMYAYIYIYIYIYMYVCAYVCVCPCIYVCTKKHTRTHTNTSRCMRTIIHAWLNTRACKQQDTNNKYHDLINIHRITHTHSTMHICTNIHKYCTYTGGNLIILATAERSLFKAPARNVYTHQKLLSKQIY